MNTQFKFKRLRALTIIPEELYVRRAADDQLRDVVENMGRPGYVLVARQMGKTNLLLNAKRELSNDGNIFLYVDLSNFYPTLQQFFRNIIDTAVEAHSEIFGVVASTILESRARNITLPAHKEHEQELRLLLRCTSGKIVICLDEIDALTKSPYSDSVFSLIRSTYFASRINYTEFNRLTYILSGVAEPTEIIKNKDISPFNIGEKIYLDDFTFDEYLSFLKKANLDFSTEVVNRIFYWTNGNPRMCWDLCSALENEVLTGLSIETAEVDNVVRKLYLTSYDLAPVDHIRQLVEDDKEIRNAVMSIHYGKPSTVTDLQRTKLYLAGIVKANFLSGELVIKNKVIEESLSEEWISSIENSRLSLRELADRKMAEHDYEAALKIYQSYEANVPSVDKDLLYHNMGECCIRMGDYSGAVEYLTRSPAKKSSFAMLFFRQQLWIGISQFKLGNIDESIARLNSVINSDFTEGYPIEYFEALVNRTAPYFERFDTYGDEIISDCRQIIDSISQVPNADLVQVGTIKCAAYVAMSQALRRFSRVSDASRILREGIEVADISSKPVLIVQLYDLVSLTERKELLSLVCDLIEGGELSFNKVSIDAQFHFNQEIYADLLVYALEVDDLEISRRMLAALFSESFAESAGVVLQAAMIIAVSRKKGHVAKSIFRKILAIDSHGIEVKDLKTLYYYVIVVIGGADIDDVEIAFAKALGSWEANSLNERDILMVYILSEKYIRLSQYERAQSLIEMVKAKGFELARENTQQSLLHALLAVEFAELRLMLRTMNSEAVEKKAKEIKEKIPAEPVTAPIFVPKFFDDMNRELNRILISVARPVQVRNQKKFGRNDIVQCKYADGSIISGKYKNFQEDISNGKCFLLN